MVVFLKRQRANQQYSTLQKTLNLNISVLTKIFCKQPLIPSVYDLNISESKVWGSIRLISS